MRKTEQVIADADMTAVYLRQLIAQGVPLMAAVQLTSSYVQSVLITASAKEKPREPWENEDGGAG